MGIERKYRDAEGNPKTLNEMVREEPMWAASRIREGQKAIDALKDWLTCADTPEEWMRCRDRAKKALRWQEGR